MNPEYTTKPALALLKRHTLEEPAVGVLCTGVGGPLHVERSSRKDRQAVGEEWIDYSADAKKMAGFIRA